MTKNHIHYMELAAKLNDVITLKEFIEKGADIHVKNDWILCRACEKGSLEAVKFLVEQGAHINVNDASPLRLAAENGHLDTVKFLVKTGIFPSGGYDFSRLPIELAHEIHKVIVDAYNNAVGGARRSARDLN